MARLLVIIGIALVIAGLLWPWLMRIGLGNLPGDVWIRGERFSFYFPITTCIILSLLLSVVIWLLNR